MNGQSMKIKALSIPISIALLFSLGACSWLQENGWIDPPPSPQNEGEAVDSAPIPTVKSRMGVAKREVKPAPVAEPQRKPVVTALSASQFRGLAPEAVLDLLGTPDEVFMNTPSLIWRYRAGPCTVAFQFFKELETEIYRTLQYEIEGGDEIMCLARIERRKVG